jgi:hypothetical protein
MVDFMITFEDECFMVGIGALIVDLFVFSDLRHVSVIFGDSGSNNFSS